MFIALLDFRIASFVWILLLLTIDVKLHAL
jgi:hypothetical protein